MFSANGTFTGTIGNQTWYIPDYYISTLACADQIQLCNSATANCSPLMGSDPTAYLQLGLTKSQQATAVRLILAHQHSHIYDVVNGRGGSALAASDLLVNLFSHELPDNQWIAEATQMFQTALANVQLRIVDFLTNTWFTNTTRNLLVLAASAVDPDDKGPEMEALCRQQRVQSTAEYQSFSLAGVIIVCVLSPAVITTSWFLESCVKQRKSLQSNGSKRYRRLAWVADGKLQLLRMALTGSGYRGWEHEMDDVPVRSGVKDIQPPFEDHDAVLYPNVTSREDSHDEPVEEMELLQSNRS